MTRVTATSDSLSGYQLRLPSFEGALDVLLALIERERLEISNLSLVLVTDGFLEYIGGMRNPPAALLAEFAGIAARLLVLKSRSLLPKPDVIEQETDVDDLAARWSTRATAEQRKRFERNVAKARAKDSLRAADRLTCVIDGRRRIASDPPLIVPIEELLAPNDSAALETMLRDLLRP